MPTRSFQVYGADPNDPRAVANARAANDVVYRQQLELQRQRQAPFRRAFNVARAVGIGVPAAFAAGPALSGLFSGGGGSAAGAGAAGYSSPGIYGGVSFGAPAGAATSIAAPAATAAKAGTMATIGKLFNSPGMELGVNAGLNLLGMNQQRKAADQARADALAAQREALALERQRLEMEATNANLDRADAKALNDAINELKRRELEAAEEERAYIRTKDETRETRLAPYRNVSESALRRLSSMWGLS